MQEVKNNSSITINQNKPRKSARAAFVAETPVVKARKSAINFMRGASGRYVRVETAYDKVLSTVTGMMVCAAGNDYNNYFVVIDQDRKVQVLPSDVSQVQIYRDEFPMSLSILDYLKWHDTDFLIDLVKEAINSKKLDTLTNITVNWHKQYASKKESKENQKSKKKTNKK